MTADPPGVPRSPWERALGSRIDELDAGLRDYFGAIPAGAVGRGSGVFHVVGTPRRWLWPLFVLLAHEGILFPVWERDVHFTVENRSTPAGTVRAIRTFGFLAGDQVMVDETGITSAGLTDRLGRHGFVSATFDASAIDGRLELRSMGTTLRLGRVRLPLGLLSPRVTLVEQRQGSRQHVRLTVDAPVLGRLYEYSGTFTYTIEDRYP